MNKKVFTHNNKKIVSYKNAFNYRENLALYDQIVNTPFTRTNIDIYLLNNKDSDSKWWSVVEPTSELSRLINPKYMNIIDELDWDRVKITGQYINFGTSNTVDLIHADVQEEGKNAYTILHYATHTWDPNWHGNTLFYCDDRESIIHGETFEPGKIVVFDSSITHSATPPSIKAEYARYTIATKLFLQ